MLDVFARRLRAYRKLKHWTQVELGKQVGVSVAVIGALERGTREPNEELLRSLCTVLTASEEELGIVRQQDGSLDFKSDSPSF
ncbi:helix-turn-helix transcriptional regulator [Alicyclobacillus sp. SO9]|uniref:helix-turn-helix transcriptional regulator n=1 Tax=Alicyclobacillus sp. SO9 TaxID=2665646 RepID=UPI0018E726E9|nr:helix-turn-helix transcriptional regulator [Alicyclobacillus sp. SO9]QQE79431.1 helix-turn-helix transcriptional regulator [Alicyclobacillus sp. SO9]